MKSYFLLLFSMFILLTATSQNSSNYSATTTTTGSLTDMSRGTTLLVGADQDDAASLLPILGSNFSLWESDMGSFPLIPMDHSD